jgi:hypothetical protein
MACAKADRGVVGRDAFDARERSLLTLMALARSAFNRHVPGGSEVTPAPWAASASALTHRGDRSALRVPPPVPRP